MTESKRDQKLVQYLEEAYGKEKELESALQAHIEMTDRAPYRKRLRQHLKETKGHARVVERRIGKLGGGRHLIQDVTARATAMAKSPVRALRGKSDEEKLLKNAKTAYSDEAEEIATYTAIETLAESVGDRETAKMARQIRREEERMASFLARQIPVLTKAVARAEIPAQERKPASSRRSSSRSGSRRRRATSSRAKRGRTQSRGSRARQRARS